MSAPEHSLALGVAAALAGAVVVNLGMVVQALEAREVPPRLALRPTLLLRLARRPRWLLGTVVGYLGFPLHVLALLEAPLVVVEPVHAAGLLVPLAAGAFALGERVERRHLAAVAALALGLGLLTRCAPDGRDAPITPWALVAATAAVAAVAAVPYVLPAPRRHGVPLILCSGLGFAATNLAAKGFSDRLAASAYPLAAAWLAAAAVLGTSAMLLQMTAFQHHRAIDVVPVAFAVPTFVPVLLAPLVLEEHWGRGLALRVGFAAGTALVVAASVMLARARPVLRVAEREMAAARERRAQTR